MRLLLVDNYDSFTYNLFQLFLTRAQFGCTIDVVRHDAELCAEDILTSYHGLIISPGPGGPEDSGISIQLARQCQGRMPVLGICLGHQLLAWLHGAPIERAPVPTHGKTSQVHHHGGGLLRGIPSPFRVMRYHSLHVPKDGVPEDFIIDGISEDGVVMALSHRSFPSWGLQFHPESFLSEYGNRIAENFLAFCGRRL